MTKALIHDGKLDRAAAADALREFLQTMIRAGELDLQAKVHAAEGPAGVEEGEAEVFADLDGRDKEILLARGGAVLKALEHLALRRLILEPTYNEKIRIDWGGLRKLCVEEFRMSARVTA